MLYSSKSPITKYLIRKKTGLPRRTTRNTLHFLESIDGLRITNADFKGKAVKHYEAKREPIKLICDGVYIEIGRVD